MKNFFQILATVGVGFPLLASADVTSTIQLPASFSSEVITQVTNLLSNFSSYITLIVGVLLAVVVIEILIGAIHRK